MVPAATGSPTRLGNPSALMVPGQLVAGLLVALCGFLVVPLPQAQQIVAVAIDQGVRNELSLVATVAGLVVGFLWWRRQGGWAGILAFVVVAGIGNNPGLSLPFVAFVLGRFLGLGPISGYATWAFGVFVGYAISVGALGLQDSDALEYSGIALAVAGAVSAWFFVAEKTQATNLPRWTPWLAAFGAMALVAVIGGGIGLLIGTSPQAAVVRVENFGPNSINVSTGFSETSPPRRGTTLACGSTTIVHPPAGSHGPWWVYAGPASSQVNGGNNVPFSVYDQYSNQPRVLLAPAQRSWIERWLPRANCRRAA